MQEITGGGGVAETQSDATPNVYQQKISRNNS